MFTPDVRLEGFSPEQWTTLGRLLRGADERASALAPKSGLIALTAGPELRKLVSTRAGRIDPSDQLWPVDLPTLAGLHGAHWAARLSVGALDDLADRFAARLDPEHDLLDQTLLLLHAARELEREGRIEVWPWRIEHWPIPSPRMITRAFDAACAEGKVLLLGAFEDGEVRTCLALRRGGRGFDWIVGPGALLPSMGLTSGDWRRDYRYLAQATERRVGPLATGCFGEFRTLQRLMSEAEPGAWAAAVASSEIILSPVSPALTIPLGIDLGRGALQALRGVALRLGASSWMHSGGLLASALARVQDLQGLLGFDPILLLGRLLGREARYKQLGADAAPPAPRSEQQGEP